MNVYVAGSSKELPRVRAIMRTLTSLGHVITYDWTVPVEVNGEDERQPKELLAGAARADLDGVRRADVFLLLWPRVESTGAHTEHGYALALRDMAPTPRFRTRPLIVLSMSKPKSCFWALADFIEEHDAAAVARVLDLVA